MNKNLTEKIADGLARGIELVLKPMQDRMSNIITGTFVLSLIAVNWRMLLYLIVSKEDIAQTFIFIDTVLYPSIWWKVGMFFVIPGLLTIIYSYFIPQLTEKIEIKTDAYKKSKQVRSQKKVRNFLKHNVKAMELLAEAERKKTDYDDARKSTEEIVRLTVEVEKLKDDIDLLNKTAHEESIKYNKLIEKNYTLSVDNDKLDSGLKSILSYILKGNFNVSGRYLRQIVTGLHLEDGKVREELLNIINKETEVNYKITVEHEEDGISSVLDHTSVLFNTDGNFHSSGNHVIFNIKTDNEEDPAEIEERILRLPTVKDVVLEKL